MAEFASLANILHAHRLTANGVVSHCQYEERDVAFVFFQDLLELVDVDIAFERSFELCVVFLTHCDVDSECLTALDMTFCGVEVSVSRDDLTWFHEV